MPKMQLLKASKRHAFNEASKRHAFDEARGRDKDAEDMILL